MRAPRVPEAGRRRVPWAPALPAVLLLALATACGDGGGAADGGSTPDGAIDGGDAGAPDGSTDGGAPEDGGPADGGEALILETVASGLEVPWEIRALPDGQLLVTERPGRLVRIDPGTGEVTQVAAFRVFDQGEAGLMGLALHPDFESNRWIYLCLTEPTDPPVNRVARFVFDGGALSEGTNVVENVPADDVHDGCRLAFGPEGYLWVTLGDATVASDAQDTGRLNGKVLRVSDDGAIPEDNPFGNAVYTYGHRNPQGLDFHPETGEPFLSEHGPDDHDEINVLVSGGNYGWPEVTGPSDEPAFVDPLYSWVDTIAPSGAAFYPHGLIPQWSGALLVVTLRERDLRVLRPSDASFSAVSSEDLLFDEALGRLRVVRPLPDGTVLLGTSNRDGRGDPGAEDDRIVRVRPRE